MERCGTSGRPRWLLLLLCCCFGGCCCCCAAALVVATAAVVGFQFNRWCSTPLDAGGGRGMGNGKTARRTQKAARRKLQVPVWRHHRPRGEGVG